MTPKFDILKLEELQKKEIVLECEFCKKDFHCMKSEIRKVLNNHPCLLLKYCSKDCSNKAKKTGNFFNCVICDKKIYRDKKNIRINKSGKFFCSASCKAIDWNKNKNYGFSRSKMEVFIEEELSKKFDFEILFNNRNILNCNYELDIFIPKLNLAFELNGIFHYEPIFGSEKLKITQDKDLIKFEECKTKNIELYVLDITDSKSFNKIKDKKYLDFIFNKIELKKHECSLSVDGNCLQNNLD